MTTRKLTAALAERYGTAFEVPQTLAGIEALNTLAARGSCRWFREEPLPHDLLEALSAIALSAPSKSDLQQRDIIILRDPDRLNAVKALMTDQDWIQKVPSMVIICANNHRQRRMHEWHGRSFENDHLDAFFNASVDAGIALASFVHAAEAAGLGSCPISSIRNRSAEVSDLLGLPDHVFVVAAVAVGYPQFPEPRISMRLPVTATIHTDRFSSEGLQEDVAAYDAARNAHRPVQSQRQTEQFGQVDPYTWSDDKTRQYIAVERADFGAFIRSKGFTLD